MKLRSVSQAPNLSTALRLPFGGARAPDSKRCWCQSSALRKLPRFKELPDEPEGFYLLDTGTNLQRRRKNYIPAWEGTIK